MNAHASSPSVGGSEIGFGDSRLLRRASSCPGELEFPEPEGVEHPVVAAREDHPAVLVGGVVDERLVRRVDVDRVVLVQRDARHDPRRRVDDVPQLPDVVVGSEGHRPANAASDRRVLSIPWT